VFHYTIVVFSEGVPDLGGRIPLKPYTFQIGGQGERDDKNTMMRSLLFLPPFLSSLVLSLKNPSTAMDSPAALGFSTILWKEEDVGDKKCHFKQLSPGKCDKYCHPTTVGRGVTTRYGMEWRSACTSGMSRAKPISDGHLPLVGAEDGAHHVGDLAERGVADRGVSAREPLSTSAPHSADPAWPVHGQDRDARDTEEIHQARWAGHYPEDGGQKIGKKLLIDFEQSHRSDPAIAKTPPAAMMTSPSRARGSPIFPRAAAAARRTCPSRSRRNRIKGPTLRGSFLLASSFPASRDPARVP